jgi:uncharacterized protein YhbP (UPF0306 family)
MRVYEINMQPSKNIYNKLGIFKTLKWNVIKTKWHNNRS